MKPLFEVYEFSCVECDGLVEIRPDRYGDSGRIIYELRCNQCGQRLQMSAELLDQRTTDSAGASTHEK